MTQILALTSSSLGEASVSTKLVHKAVDVLKAKHAGAHVQWRDLSKHTPPHLDADAIGGLRGEPTTDAQKSARALSDALIAEMMKADILVIGAPMYNFGIPTQLKSWFDYVLRVGVTFRYTEKGPEGLVNGKKAIVIETRGGLYSEGPAAVMDAQEPHIRAMLGFIGIRDVTFIHAEKLARGPDSVAESIEAASKKIASLG
jgi:FMN-dependent NADH-azoreductase